MTKMVRITSGEFKERVGHLEGSDSAPWVVICVKGVWHEIDASSVTFETFVIGEEEN